MLNILNVAQTGLSVSQTQVEGVMNNLANENTPGYKSRVVNVAELDHADDRQTGRGVVVEDISRITNAYMYQNLVNEEAKLNSLDELDIMLDNIESIFHETDDSGLSADLNRYFQSLENLKTSPQNEIYKNDLKNNANILIEDLNSLYEGIETKELDTLSRAEDTVEEINRILTSIGKVSADIVDSVGTPNDLLDKRDALEMELSKYVDVEISREDSYQLKIGGVTAVRFDTNVHNINLVKEYTPQRDIYTKENTVPYESNLIDVATWGIGKAEVQTVAVTGTATDQVYFLDTLVSNADGTAGHSTPEEIIDDIVADADIITNWNLANPTKEIDTITKTAAGEITVTYKVSEGDVPSITAADVKGISFATSAETVRGSFNDSISYTLNNNSSVTVTYGETVLDVNGVAVDLDGDADNTNDAIDDTNVVKALVYKINQDADMLGKVEAYNGMYELDVDGNKILTNNPLHSQYDALDPEKDRYLVVESLTDGEKGKFVGEIVLNDNDTLDLNGKPIGENIIKDQYLSKEGIDDIHLEIYEEEIFISGGILNPMIENIKTESNANKFTEYKTMLDNFAKVLSDMSSAYIENEDGTYIYGMDESQRDPDNANKVTIGLFTGANVSSLEFHDSMVNTLTQEKLDYLTSIQWQNDIDFDGTGQNNTSISKYYQTIRVEIADNRETVIFKKETQAVVKEAMETTYDKLTKVDKDKEMVELIKFQAAYEANAKMITIVDEMLQTILGMKR